MDWVIETDIAAGTFGTVSQVRHRLTGEVAAFKQIHPAYQAERQRIKAGFITAKQVQHPHCVRMIEWVETGEMFGFVMELIQGKPISERFPAGFPSDISAVIPLLIQLCQGLDALHSCQIVHRDLKPANILVTEEDCLKITDFDLIRWQGSMPEVSPGTFLGTVHYAAPEQCNNASQVDPRSDLYAMGVVLYELVTGRLPFHGKTWTEIAFQHLNTAVTPPIRYRPELPSIVNDLICQLLAKDPADRPPSALDVIARVRQLIPCELSIPQQPAGMYLLPPQLMGRTVQITALQNALTAAQAGTSYTLFLAGEAGIGKTRLWETFQSIYLQNAIVFQTKCTPEQRLYEPLRDLLTQLLARFADRSDAEKARWFGEQAWELTTIMPELASHSFMSQIEAHPPSSPQKAEKERLTTFCNLLKQVAADESIPLVIYMDDLHWADTHVAKFIYHAVDQLAGSGVLLIGSYRPDAVPDSSLQPILPLLESNPDVKILPLPPLDTAGIHDMVVSMLGLPRDTPEPETPFTPGRLHPTSFAFQRLIKTLAQQTGGNPFFVREVLEHLLDEGILTRHIQGWFLDVEALERQELPDNLQTVIRERLDRLNATVQNVLQVAALIGNVFEIDSLLMLLDQSEDAVMTALNEARQMRLIDDERGNYQFVHDAVREILLAEIDSDHATAWHRKMAEMLEEQYLADPVEQGVEALAHHFYAANLPEKALHYYKQAVDIARRCYANDQALQWYQRVMELAKTLEDPITYWDYQFKKGEILMLTGAWEQAEAVYHKALQRAQTMNDTFRIGKALGHLGRVADLTGRYEDALDYFEQELSIGRSLNNENQVTTALGSIGLIYYRQGQLDKAQQRLETVLEMSRRINDKTKMMVALCNLGNIHADKHHYDTAMDYYLQHLALAEEMGNQREVAWAWGNMGTVYDDQGDFAGAMRCYRKQLALCQQLDDKVALLVVMENIGTLLQTQGDFEEALNWFDQQLGLATDIGDKSAQLNAYHARGRLFFELNRFHEADEAYRHALTLARQMGIQHKLADVLVDTARLAFAQQKYDSVAPLLTEAQYLAEQTKKVDTDFRCRLLRAELDAKQGKPEEARTQLQDLAVIADSLHQQAQIAYAQWWVCCQMGDPRAADYQQQALERYEQLYRQTPTLSYQKRVKTLKEGSQTMASETSTLSLIQALVKLMNPEVAFTELLRFLVDFCQADCGQVIVHNSKTDRLEVRAVSSGMDTDDVDFSRSILLKTFNQNQPLCVANAADEAEFRENPSVISKPFLSVLTVPMRIQGNGIGAVYLDRRQVKRGAFDPAILQQVQQVADILTPVLVQQEEAEHLRVQSEIQHLGFFVGNSKRMQAVYQAIEEAAKVNLTVLIQGETGTGKELVARALHRLSSRRQAPFIAVNCAAIPRELAESELFGQERGAFTGAVAKPGKFELAQGGTLFLDEIAELSVEIQAKLLRALEEKQVWRIGGKHPLPVDVRIVAASHRQLEKEIAQGTFRQDLYYRLNVLRIYVPPLADRPEDIPLLAYHFLEKYAQECHKPITGFTKEALEALKRQKWTGNVRELQNTIAKAVLRQKADQLLTVGDLFPDQPVNLPATRPVADTPTLDQVVHLLDGDTLDDKKNALERYLVERALNQSGWNISQAAAALGVYRHRVYKLIEKYGLAPS